jgi:hypothetical protein
LLVEGKYAFHLPGYDADSLFVTIAQKLGCFPSDPITKPFSHLRELIGEIPDFAPLGQEKGWTFWKGPARTYKP